MRVISGKYKGRRLKSFNADHIRPTMDRVKESLFNIIQADLPDALVLDLFSGTGSLGIEALSRGAQEVCFVESHPTSIRIIRDNLKSLGIEDDYKIFTQDVFKFLQGTSPINYQIVFIDPPFTKAWAHRVMEAVSECKFLASRALIAIEAAKQERIDDNYPGLELLDRRQFGDKSLSLFRKVGGD